MELTVRPMAAQDAATLAQLEQLSFSQPWSAAAITAELAKDTAVFLVACAPDGALCGYIGMNYVLDEGYINNLAVFPQLRGQGVGRRLLQALVAWCVQLGLAFVTLEVRPANTAAVALYSGCGFVQAGVRRGFYSSPQEDALLMTRYFADKEQQQDEN